ncbi:MAG: hypothetical protein ACOYD4_06765 [Solirubrobacterales bacterium]
MTTDVTAEATFPPKFRATVDLEKELDKAQRKIERKREEIAELKNKNRRLKNKVKRLKTQVEAKQTTAIGRDAELPSWE